jgi:hypothetical protein
MLRGEIIYNGGDKPRLSVKAPGFNKQGPGCGFSLQEFPCVAGFASQSLLIFDKKTHPMVIWIAFQMGLKANLQ